MRRCGSVLIRHLITQSQTRIFVVNDLERDRPEATASAMAGLMTAAGGGSLAYSPRFVA